MREDKGQPPGMHIKASHRQRAHPWPPQRLSVSPLFFPSAEKCWCRGMGRQTKSYWGLASSSSLSSVLWGLGPARGDSGEGGQGERESLIGTNHSESRSSHLARPQEIDLSKYPLMRESQLCFAYVLFMPSTFRKGWR